MCSAAVTNSAVRILSLSNKQELCFEEEKAVAIGLTILAWSNDRLHVPVVFKAL